MNDWNEALVGAQPIRPFHAGSVKAPISLGSSDASSARES